jgi:hypothetical protein
MESNNKKGIAASNTFKPKMSGGGANQMPK